MKVLENPLFAVHCTDCEQLHIIRITEDAVEELGLEPVACPDCQSYLPLTAIYKTVEKLNTVAA
jgi:formate dehydrogenase maturation protein FdhE